MEVILSHFNAKTLKNKQITSDILTQLLKETNTIFCLDGDLCHGGLVAHNIEYDMVSHWERTGFLSI